MDLALVKTDAEGHDLEVLQGMNQVVTDHQPLILTESLLNSELREICDGWEYRIFAFVCDRRTMKMRFQEMTASLDHPWYKMLFLVPKRLIGAFSQMK